jgi:thioredoxin reductase (NADPH)
MEQMEKQAEHVGTDIISDHIHRVDFSKKPFQLTGESGHTYTADTVVLATGASAKWLGLPTEHKFQGYGVSGCATCDGFFFRGKEVLVIGGGNTAVEEALYLTNHASKVTLIHRRDTLRAEKIAQERLFKHPKVSVIWDSALEEVVGTHDPISVTGAKIKNLKTGEVKTLNADGIFIAIGHQPNTAIFKGQIELDSDGYILTTPGSTKTNIDGVFAAGDVQDKIFRQAVTAAGTGCMAALEAAKYIEHNHS